MGFVPGFLAPFEGFFHLLARPKLWPYAAIPIILNILLVIAGGWLFIHYALPWAEVHSPGWSGSAGLWVVRVIAFIALLPLALALYIVFASILGGPFYEVLCARTEAEMLGHGVAEPEPKNFFKVAIDGVRVEMGNLVVSIIGGTLALLAPFLVPGVGAIASVPLGWFLAGFGYIAYPFDRRATNLRRKLQVAFRHLPETLGFGLAVYFLLIPIVTVPLVAPCAVIGAAKLFPGGQRADPRKKPPFTAF